MFDIVCILYFLVAQAYFLHVNVILHKNIYADISKALPQLQGNATNQC